MTNNQKIKTALKKARIPQWRLADYLGIREDSLSRMFRYEIKPDKAGEMLLAIEKIGREVKK
ncbi:hypothetical protein [Sporomusa acidovorans]|uniref:HTH cro/C1-type domain-containing protein n=1 Tax=Sporomusa acidovorans (strain ATCC 49682 / DSM 3132 / Mol) TaxID=1123286 RepID=A0ABZ3IYH8_SPOA4|nr:hypothetical protein [Sporomusa acidovorans]OZC22087.1 hypothetical protein SPACI_16050 [Sporomusa acidovorans DSM 3132]SDF66095.1 hypothetical protein SAMN04488499_106612 [Sporomusa acidovorans]